MIMDGSEHYLEFLLKPHLQENVRGNLRLKFCLRCSAMARTTTYAVPGKKPDLILTNTVSEVASDADFGTPFSASSWLSLRYRVTILAICARRAASSFSRAQIFCSASSFARGVFSGGSSGDRFVSRKTED